jgi:hypothetical protein
MDEIAHQEAVDPVARPEPRPGHGGAQRPRCRRSARLSGSPAARIFSAAVSTS